MFLYLRTIASIWILATCKCAARINARIFGSRILAALPIRFILAPIIRILPIETNRFLSTFGKATAVGGRRWRRCIIPWLNQITIIQIQIILGWLWWWGWLGGLRWWWWCGWYWWYGWLSFHYYLRQWRWLWLTIFTAATRIAYKLLTCNHVMFGMAANLTNVTIIVTIVCISMLYVQFVVWIIVWIRLQSGVIFKQQLTVVARWK